MIPKCFTHVNCHGMAMLLLPVILIKTLAVIFGISSPDQAAASSHQSGVSPLHHQQSTQRTWTELQLAAGAQVEHLRQLHFGNDPLLHALEDGAIESVPDMPGVKLALQVIMSFQSGSVALISGEQYREGDLIKSSPWKVILINGDVRSVTLRNEDTGEEWMLTVERNH